MPVTVLGDPTVNTINIHPRFLAEGHGTINLTGSRAVVEISEQHASGVVLIYAGAGSHIRIGHACVIGSLTLHALVEGASICIGENVLFNGAADLAVHEASEISIGDKCLIADGCSMSTSDVHTIHDKVTGQRLNPARSISIGPGTWIGGRVTVTKGVSVGAGSIIGIGSIVTKTFTPNSMIAGVPAKLIREGVEWRL